MLRFYEGRITITTAGEPQLIRLGIDDEYITLRDAIEVGASVVVRNFALTADSSNSGSIVIGGEKVVAALATRQGFQSIEPGQRFVYPIMDLQRLWVDAETDGNGCYFGFEYDLDA